MGTVRAGPVTPVRTGLTFTRSPDLTNVGGRAVRRHQLLMHKIRGLEERPAFAPLPGLPADRLHHVRSPHLVVTSGIYHDFVMETLRRLGLTDSVAVYAPAMTTP